MDLRGEFFIKPTSEKPFHHRRVRYKLLSINFTQVLIPSHNGSYSEKAHALPQINAQLTSHKLQVEMIAAKERDQEDLAGRLDKLARNDQLILHALQDGDQKVRRLEELVIAFTKVSFLHIFRNSINEFCSCPVPSQSL
jgi:hypothetical protein